MWVCYTFARNVHNLVQASVLSKKFNIKRNSHFSIQLWMVCVTTECVFPWLGKDQLRFFTNAGRPPLLEALFANAVYVQGSCGRNYYFACTLYLQLAPLPSSISYSWSHYLLYQLSESRPVAPQGRDVDLLLLHEVGCAGFFLFHLFLILLHCSPCSLIRTEALACSFIWSRLWFCPSICISVGGAVFSTTSWLWPDLLHSLLESHWTYSTLCWTSRMLWLQIGYWNVTKCEVE